MTDIVNTKTTKDLKKNTISNFSKKEAIQLFQTEFNKKRIDATLFWLVELHCSGHIDFIWQYLFLNMSNNINILNPKLPTYLLNNYISYNKIKKKYKRNILDMRNCQQTRKQLTDIIIISIQSATTPLLSDEGKYKINITKKIAEDIRPYVRATNFRLVTNIIKQNDHPIVKIAINELSLHLLTKESRYTKVLFWIKVLDKYHRINKNIKNEPRNINNIDEKYHIEWVWIVWDVILNLSKNTLNTIAQEQINSLFDIYKLDFSKSMQNKKLCHILHAILLIKTNPDWSIKITNNETIKHKKIKSIGRLYEALNTRNKQIVKSPTKSTDAMSIFNYLGNLHQSSVIDNFTNVDQHIIGNDNLFDTTYINQHRLSQSKPKTIQHTNFNNYKQINNNDNDSSQQYYLENNNQQTLVQKQSDTIQHTNFNNYKQINNNDNDSSQQSDTIQNNDLINDILSKNKVNELKQPNLVNTIINNHDITIDDKYNYLFDYTPTIQHNTIEHVSIQDMLNDTTNLRTITLKKK
jgi:hypothetical protein